VAVSISKIHANKRERLSINAFGMCLKFCLYLLNLALAKGNHIRAIKHRSLTQNFAIYGVLTPK